MVVPSHSLLFQSRLGKTSIPVDKDWKGPHQQAVFDCPKDICNYTEAKELRTWFLG